MKKYSALFLLMSLWLVSCEKVSDLSDEASIESFQVLSYTPESAVVGEVYMSGGDVIIPVKPQEDLFPFSVRVAMTTSSTTHTVLGDSTEGAALKFSSGSSEFRFHLIAESGQPHTYTLSLYPTDTGADIKEFSFTGSDGTTVALDPWNALVYISDPDHSLDDDGSYSISGISILTSEGAMAQCVDNFTFDTYEDCMEITVTAADGQTTRVWKVYFTELYQIPNSDFELWGKFGNDINNNVLTIDPMPGKGQGWATANNTFVLGAEPFDYQGGKAARLTTKIQDAIIFGDLIAAGSLYTGYFQIDVNNLDDSRSMTYFGVPYTLRPAALEFDARYVPGDTLKQAVKNGYRYEIQDIEGTDSGHAWIHLIHWDSSKDFAYHGREEDGATLLGSGEIIFDGNNSAYRNWGHYRIDIEYTNRDLLPTHVAIVFSSSQKGDEYIGAPGSVMEVDNVQLIY